MSGNTSLKLWFLVWALVAAGSAAAAPTEDPTYRFTGTAPGKTEAFEVKGPWSVSWTAASDLPELAFMELHLYDANTDRFLGLLAQIDGTGQGERVVREPGQYRIVVTGRNTRWSVNVSPVDGDLAALVESRPDVQRIQLVQPGTGLSRELLNEATGWRADGEKAVLLTTRDDTTVRIPVHEGTVCPGLPDSRSIYFVTTGFNTDLFNAILLEDGTRCYIDNPVPLLEAVRQAEQE